jgi:DNA modification methylase
MAKAGKKFIDLGERGKYSTKNKLNNLTGKEWIKFSKSWFIHRPPRRKENELLHPAKFPETLIEEFISFFTKENAWILDPFMGTGSTLIAAGNIKRNAIGIELSNKYYQTARRRIDNQNYKSKLIPLNGSSAELTKVLNERKISKIKPCLPPACPVGRAGRFDYVITSPPYWNQLERNSLRQKSRSEQGLATKYSNNKNDLGNIKSYDEFLEKLCLIFDNVYALTKDGSYLTIIINNIYFQGQLYPLAFDLAGMLTKRNDKSWILKDEKIWLQNDKPLIALGVNNAWVANRHHQYCLIFRKERNKEIER